MDKTVELFAYLLLSMIGFVMPVAAIILSIFGQGFVKLSAQYEAESTQARKKLSDQLKKAGESDSIDEKEIEETIKQLRSIKSTAESKLRLLSPKKAILNLFIPLLIAFGAILPSLLRPSVYTYSPLLLSLVSTGIALNQFWRVLDIIVEAKRMLDNDAKDDQRRIPELLAQIASSVKEGERYFLSKVYASFLGVMLKKHISEVTLSVDKKTEVPISFHNLEVRMAKDVEIGFRFPLEFLVEKKDKYTVYATELDQIVRYSSDRVHGDTELVLSTLA